MALKRPNKRQRLLNRRRALEEDQHSHATEATELVLSNSLKYADIAKFTDQAQNLSLNIVTLGIDPIIPSACETSIVSQVVLNNLSKYSQ